MTFHAAVTLSAPAPAKINLFLHVTGQRPDHYHLLESIFCPISLCDHVEIQLQTNPNQQIRIHRSGPLAQLPAHIDLTARAANAFFEHAGLSQGFELHLRVTKNIPEQAGLGGGSSNAATTLKLLQAHFGHPIPPAALHQIALKLGADVPFFLGAQTAFVEGIGERIIPLGTPAAWLLVYKPTISCATAQIFSDPELTRDSTSVKMTLFDSRHCIENPNWQQSLWECIRDQTGNSLQTVVARLNPEWKRQFDTFNDIVQAHDPLLVRMTGSGSAMFAVFKHCKSRDLASEKVHTWSPGLAGHCWSCQIESSGS